MQSSRAAFLAIASLLTPCVHGDGELIPRAIPVEAGPTAAAVSTSGQFRVHGADPPLRGSVALLAEESRTALLRLLDESDPTPALPVHIHLRSAGDASIASGGINTSITYHAEGFEIHLWVPVGRGLDLERFKNAITAALAYERSLQKLKPGASDEPLFVPPWLVEGIREADRWQRGASERRLYETLFRSGGLFNLDEIFSTGDAAFLRLDAASRAAFQVSSGALVMALLEQDGGKPAFRSFLSEAASFAGEMPALLRRHFPDLNLSENSMAKWWALQMAQKSNARLTESLSILETEAALARSLILHFRDDDGQLRTESIDAWPDVLELEPEDRPAATRMAAEALVHLSYRCFPTYRPLLAAYQQTLIDLQQNGPSREEIAAQIANLQELRRNMIDRAERARDFMDWFEITRARETSGAFDDYLRLKQQLGREARRPRADSVSTTLDRFDIIFHRDTGDRHDRMPGNW